MAKVGDKTHTPHGVGTITEVDTVRGRTQFRVAGAGFSVWMDETKVHVANEGGGLFGYGPWAEEAADTPQYALGIDRERPEVEHFAGLDATIEPGSTPVNENNSTDLPYDWTPQYHHDVWADEQTIQPGEQEIDAADRLRATDSVSGDRASERPYPGPNPDLFAKSAGTSWFGDDEYDPYDEYAKRIENRNKAEEDALYAEWTEPKGRHAFTDGGPADESWGDNVNYNDEGWGQSEDDEFWRHHPRPGSDAYYEKPPGMQRAKGWNGMPDEDYPWAPGYTPDDEDIEARSHLKHPESGELSPGESWGHLAYHVDDDGSYHDVNTEGEEIWADQRKKHHKHKHHDSITWGVPSLGSPSEHEGSYRPAGLSDRYAHFDLEAAGNPDSPVERFRRDPVGFIELCGHLWTDGDDSLEKFADYSQLIDVDPAMREAAWSDVRQKAQRLRMEGRVHVNDMGEGRIYATVEGDHGTYDTMIAKNGSMGGFGGGQSITNWACSCDWGKHAFTRKHTYVGRLCSHGYAAYLTMQSDYTKANPITKNQPYKKKWAGRHDTDPHDPYKNTMADDHYDGLYEEALPTGSFSDLDLDPQPKHRKRTAGVVEDYKSWLDENGQAPEAASVAAYLNTEGGGVSDEDVEKLYDYISDNHDEVPERDFDIEYVNTPGEAYKTAAEWSSDPTAEWRQDRGLHPSTPQFEIGADGHHHVKTPAHSDGYNPIKFDHQAALLRTTPRSLTPNLRNVPEGEDEQWVDVTKDDRETTGPDNNVHEAMLRYLHGAGITDFATGGGGDSAGAGLDSPGSAPAAPTAPSGGGGGEGLWDATSVGGTNVDAKSFQQTGSRRFAESSDAALLDKLRDLSTTPAAEDLGHMDDHNEELRDLVDELNDRGYDASFMVAAVEDDPTNANGNFIGQSHPTWADEAFSGSGPNPKKWFSDSAGYVDENERDRFVDVTDAPDGDIIKFNDSRSAPEQGPKKSSRRHADNFSADSGVTSTSPGMGGSSMGAPEEVPSEPFDVSQTLASLHFGGEPTADDWENASGEPFVNEVKKELGQDDEGGEGEGDEGGGGGSGLGAVLPGLLKGLSGGGAAGAAAGAAGAAGGGAELAGLAVLAAGGGGGVRRAGHGAASQVRVDPGTRQPNRPRQAMSPPDDFGFDGAPDMERYAAADDGGDIVAAFQRSAGAAEVMNGSGGGGSDDIAERALAFLRTAGRKYSPAEQRELEAEHHPLGARNLPTDDELQGTHYVLGM